MLTCQLTKLETAFEQVRKAYPKLNPTDAALIASALTLTGRHAIALYEGTQYFWPEDYESLTNAMVKQLEMVNSGIEPPKKSKTAPEEEPVVVTVGLTPNLSAGERQLGDRKDLKALLGETLKDGVEFVYAATDIGWQWALDRVNWSTVSGGDLSRRIKIKATFTEGAVGVEMGVGGPKRRSKKVTSGDDSDEDGTPRPPQKTAEERAAERQALAEQKAAEKKALAEQKAAERQALIEQKAAEKRALAEQKEAERRAAAEKKEAEKKALADKKEAEKRAVAEKKEKERIKLAEKKEAERRKAQEKKDKAQRILAERKEKERKAQEAKKEKARIAAERAKAKARAAAEAKARAKAKAKPKPKPVKKAASKAKPAMKKSAHKTGAAKPKKGSGGSKGKAHAARSKHPKPVAKPKAKAKKKR